MYSNKCIKCGEDFETKNPKRVICPSCLYPDRAAAPASKSPSAENEESASSSSETKPTQKRVFTNYNDNKSGGFNRGPRQGGFNRGPRQGGFNRGPRRGGFNKGPKKQLISKEQVAQIEELYKPALPLPNPDIHEVIGEKIGLEPSKVFFGINLVRQKMNLPKLIYPKRKLAVSPEQLLAVQSLYTPFLPLPPIGVHKIIAMQLKIDEWRVHVAIKLIRKQLDLPRWNSEREDAPEEYKVKAESKE